MSSTADLLNPLQLILNDSATARFALPIHKIHPSQFPDLAPPSHTVAAIFTAMQLHSEEFVDVPTYAPAFVTQ